MYHMRRSTHIGCADFLCGTIETLLILVVQIGTIEMWMWGEMVS